MNTVIFQFTNYSMPNVYTLTAITFIFNLQLNIIKVVSSYHKITKIKYQIINSFLIN